MVVCPSGDLPEEKLNSVISAMMDAFEGADNGEAWYVYRQEEEPSWCLARLYENEIIDKAASAGLDLKEAPQKVLDYMEGYVDKALSLRDDMLEEAVELSI